jgi:hypothetical protein
MTPSHKLNILIAVDRRSEYKGQGLVSFFLSLALSRRTQDFFFLAAPACRAVATDTLAL